MKFLVMLILVVFWSGCESAPVNPKPSQDNFQKRFVTLSSLQKGMSRPEVSALLGKTATVGYELVDENSDRYRPVTLPGPLKTETINKSGKIYTVDYYLAGIKIADDKVSDDEVVPVVFLKDKLAGYGWDFFNADVKGQ